MNSILFRFRSRSRSSFLFWVKKCRVHRSLGQKFLQLCEKFKFLKFFSSCLCELIRKQSDLKHTDCLTVSICSPWHIILSNKHEFKMKSTTENRRNKRNFFHFFLCTIASNNFWFIKQTIAHCSEFLTEKPTQNGAQIYILYGLKTTHHLNDKYRWDFYNISNNFLFVYFVEGSSNKMKLHRTKTTSKWKFFF